MPRKQILIETFFFPNRLSNLLMYLLHAKKVYKKIRLKWPKSLENHKAQFRKLSVFVGQKPILRHNCIQNNEDGIQIRAYKINKESVTQFNKFIS